MAIEGRAIFWFLNNGVVNEKSFLLAGFFQQILENVTYQSMIFFVLLTTPEELEAAPDDWCCNGTSCGEMLGGVGRLPPEW